MGRKILGYFILTLSFLIAGLFILKAFSKSSITEGKFTDNSPAFNSIFNFYNPFGSLLKQGIKNPFEIIVSEKTAKIPILMYHYVEYNDDERDFIRDSLNTEPHIFEAQILTLKKAGYRFITPSEIHTVLDTKESDREKVVIISFDDGYEDFYTDVFPILKKHNIKAVNYVVYNFIDRPNYMKKNQIREIIQSGLVEIGSHTMNHASLVNLDQSAAFSEMSLSKTKLEQEFGIEVKALAYPYGFYNSKVKEMARNAGYTSAVTVETGNTVSDKNLFELKRIRPGHSKEFGLLSIIEK